MKKLLLILLCVPLIGFGQDNKKELQYENYDLFKDICDCELLEIEYQIDKKVKEEAETFKEAIISIMNMSPEVESDFSFSLKVISNTSIPLILINEEGVVVQDRNIKECENIINKKDREECINSKLEEMKSANNPIDIIGEGVNDGYNQKLYFMSSYEIVKIKEFIRLVHKTCEKIETK